ncbi:MAG: GNAT family N-acetyltransferase [Brumimicrobium sp.]
MVEIKKIYRKDILSLLDDNEFWNHSFLSISKHRLYAHYLNPIIEDDDIVMLLSYLDNELVGYMGLFTDKIKINHQIEKIGWLSTWWVHPKTKGTGVGRKILETMYSENNGKIGISQFTPSAKRVYDKSGYFTTLKESIGIKAVLRSNLTFVLPSLFPKLRKTKGFLNQIDNFLNIFINLKLIIQNKIIRKSLNNISLEYVNTIDSETLNIINKYNKADLSFKGKDFFEWLKAYNWVQKAPLLELTNKDKYEFSMYDYEFEYSLIKIRKDRSCIGFIVLQKRNYVTKVLFTYFDNKKHIDDVAAIIKLQAIRQNTREIICYDKAISQNLKKSNIFLYKTKKVKHSIISKDFNSTNFEDIRMNFGDGDCSFA